MHEDHASQVLAPGFRVAAVKMDRRLVDRTLFRRDMSHGAIAGTVVGVVIGASLLVFCLYPIIVHFVKRSERQKRKQSQVVQSSFDVEAANGAEQTEAVKAGEQDSQRRPSSGESLKHEDDLAKGQVGLTQSKEADLESQNGDVKTRGEGELPFTPQRQLSDGSDLYMSEEYLRVRDTIFPYDTEYMPEDLPDENDGELKGTSADYYSPSVPSEAFGMDTNPKQDEEPPPRLSRSASFKYNVKQMFKRKSGRENSMASALSSEDTSATPKATQTSQQGTELGRIVTSSRAVESPTELSPTTDIAPPLPAVQETERSLSPPQQPANWTPASPEIAAPGTVNPMEIMPALTDSELYHKSERQLWASSYGSSPGFSVFSSSSEASGAGNASSSLSPPPASTNPDDMETSTPYYVDRLANVQEAENDEDMTDAQPHSHLSPSMIPNRHQRHSSYQSDQSTTFHGSLFTGPSSENTPSTQLDSPSPPSLISSDFRDSTSPQPPLSYRCNEPGCSQTFDQPHKLKSVHTLHLSYCQLLLTIVPGITSDTTARSTDARTKIVTRDLARRRTFNDISTTGTRRRKSFTARCRDAIILERAAEHSLERTTGSDT